MIAVTGAAGFIGSNLVRALGDQELLLVDHPLTPAKAANFAGLPRFRFFQHDEFLTQIEALKPTAVYHLGACSSTTETDWAYLTRNNIEYSQALWRYCAAAGVPYVYASSAATYGDGAKGFDDRTPPADLTPLNLYGKSKNDFDAWVLAEVESGRPRPPRWAGLKFFNVYGPREGHKGRMASVALQTFNQIRATGGMKLFRSTDPRYSDGGQLRDFVFVRDCVNHCLWMANHDHAGGVFNSGTGETRSFHDLAAAVFDALKLDRTISFTDMPADLAKQYQNYTRAETAKLRGTGCDVPVTRLEDGVAEYVAWLLLEPERQ